MVNFAKLMMIVFILNYQNSNAQFSFIAIEDSIRLSDSNCIIFCENNLSEKELSIFQSQYNNSYTLQKDINPNNDYIYFSKVIQDYNVASREKMSKRMDKYSLQQKEPFQSYAFQIYILYDNINEKEFLMVTILLKDEFPEWNKRPIYYRNGMNKYSQWVLY